MDPGVDGSRIVYNPLWIQKDILYDSAVFMETIYQ